LADPRHPRVLVVHPDVRLRDEITTALADRGFAVSSSRRPPPLAASAPAVIVADHTQLPIALPGQLLVVVATQEQGAILAAFAAGADDVLAGPLRPAELAARVAVLARTAADVSRLLVGPLAIDRIGRTVMLAGQPLELTRSEYEFLTRLASAPGRVFTKRELLDAIVLDRSASPSSARSTTPNRRVDTQAARLRRRLGDHRGLLVTVWGVGYRLG
jgi:DNA-binding response OmpR family regulator